MRARRLPTQRPGRTTRSLPFEREEGKREGKYLKGRVGKREVAGPLLLEKFTPPKEKKGRRL